MRIGRHRHVTSTPLLWRSLRLPAVFGGRRHPPHRLCRLLPPRPPPTAANRLRGGCSIWSAPRVASFLKTSRPPRERMEVKREEEGGGRRRFVKVGQYHSVLSVFRHLLPCKPYNHRYYICTARSVCVIFMIK